MKIDYDLFIIDPANSDATPEQLRDCLHDALGVLEARIQNLESSLETQQLINKKLLNLLEGRDAGI